MGFDPIGLSVRVPQGFQAELTNEGAFVLASDAPLAQAIGVGAPGQTKAALAQQMTAVIPIGGGYFRPDGAPKSQGPFLVNRYTGTFGDKTLVGWAQARLYGDGVGVTFLAIAETEPVARRITAMLFKSIRPLPKPSKTEVSTGPWAARLSGKSWVYLKTSNGLSTKKRFVLCADGRFSYYGSESYVSGGFSALGRDGSEGRWMIQGSTLTLNWNDGDVVRSTVSADGSRTYFDGVRWFQEGPAGC